MLTNEEEQIKEVIIMANGILKNGEECLESVFKK